MSLRFLISSRNDIKNRMRPTPVRDMATIGPTGGHPSLLPAMPCMITSPMMKEKRVTTARFFVIITGLVAGFILIKALNPVDSKTL